MKARGRAQFSKFAKHRRAAETVNPARVRVAHKPHKLNAKFPYTYTWLNMQRNIRERRVDDRILRNIVRYLEGIPHNSKRGTRGAARPEQGGLCRAK